MHPIRVTGHSIIAIALSLLHAESAIAQPTPAPSKPVEATLVLAGGCFWGVEAVFEHLQGVRSVTSGYAQYGTRNSASRSDVPIEAVRIVYDPMRVTHRQLLEVFFGVAHDPTSRDRQGPDDGPEYRAVVFHTTERERDASEAYRAELVKLKRFPRPIVTEVQPLASFKVAEAFHQDYAARHPNEPYIIHNDAPKLLRLKQLYSMLYRDERAP
ncbi:MAG: peptide-methionine (S)-S-oxide reductase MsrA [Gemmatimonadaceae bacterium]